MRKKIDTGVVTCDLCEKIAVEVLDSGSRCLIHSGDEKYFILQERVNTLKGLLSDIITHARAKQGSEDTFCHISEKIRTALWTT
jgi:hypothetical protein